MEGSMGVGDIVISDHEGEETLDGGRRKVAWRRPWWEWQGWMGRWQWGSPDYSKDSPVLQNGGKVVAGGAKWTVCGKLFKSQTRNTSNFISTYKKITRITLRARTWRKPWRKDERLKEKKQALAKKKQDKNHFWKDPAFGTLSLCL